MPVVFDPARAALVNVDVQRCFVEQSPLAADGGLELVDRINHLAAGCRAAGMPVIHTRGWMRSDGSNLGMMREMVPPFIVALYTAGTDTAQLHDRLEVAATDIVLDKPRYGAFHGTDLELILRSKGVDTIVVSGIATNICCETTAREAAQRDFRVIFLSDGTGTKEMNGVSADELQRSTCASLGMVFAQIGTIDEVLAEAQSRARLTA